MIKEAVLQPIDDESFQAVERLADLPAGEPLRRVCDRRISHCAEVSFAFLDGFPVSKGRALIIPKRHVVSIWEMTKEEFTGHL
jgi:diadenosine tetraphosphate (Ap4A) HIT family hydrolase